MTLCAVTLSIALSVVALTPDDAQQDPEKVQLPEGFVDVRAGSLTIEPITTEGPLPTAGYEKSPVNGAFVQSSDGEFRLQLGVYTQVRHNSNWRDAPAADDPVFGNEDSTRGWSLNRTRIFFEGKYTDRFAYHFRTNTNNSFDTELLVAWGQLKINDRWSLRFGKQFIPLSREDWMFAQDLLTIEFSPNDFTFAIGPSLGAFVSYGGAHQRLWLSVHNGAFGGRDEFPSQETDNAGTARWEWNILGDDWAVWDDQVGRRGRSRAVMLGLSGAYQGKRIEVTEGARRAGQLNADVSFNGDGYQIVIAGSATWLEPAGGDSFTNYGLLAQGGFFVTPESQLYAQYNLVDPGDQPGNLKAFNSIAFGYSYFPFEWTNRWKFSAELGHLFEALNDTIVAPSGALGWLPATNGGQTYLKLQAQFGF